jgi:hypothetical protein
MGIYSFMTTDRYTWPEGQSTIKIIVVVEDANYDLHTNSRTFIINAVNVCLTEAPEIRNDPFFGSHIYVIGDEPLELNYDADTIGNFVSAPSCGDADVSFVTLPLSADQQALFTHDRENSKFIVGKTDSITVTGLITIEWEYTNTRDVSVFTTSSLTILIVDKCNPPAGYEHQISIQAPVWAYYENEPLLDYHIGDAKQVYTPPAWIVDPPECADRVSSPSQVLLLGRSGRAVEYDGTSVNIEYSADLELCGASRHGETHWMTVTAELNGIQASADFVVRMINPCWTDRSNIDLPTISEFTYTIGSQVDNTWTIPTPTSSTICGDLTYRVEWPDFYLGAVFQPTVRRFTMNTAARQLLTDAPKTD